MLPRKHVDWDTEAERQRLASEELGEINERTFGSTYDNKDVII